MDVTETARFVTFLKDTFQPGIFSSAGFSVRGQVAELVD